VEGHVSRGFEAVREVFADSFARRRELGGACCAYRHGEKVVDLWGGVRNKQTGEPWEPDTMVIAYSATKGLAAMTLALAHSRGWLDYEERVCTYWPEFAQQGKEQITVRQLLAHQAGLYVLDEPVDRSLVADLDRLAVVLARQKPAWKPGSRQAYHGITLGFYESELLRRLELLAAPAVPPTRGFYDQCMKGHGIRFSLGFMKSSPALPFGSSSSFGSPGAGGALGFVDPETGVCYAYVTNRMGTQLAGDPRDVALRDALYSAIPARSGAFGQRVA
jgi:CubicO group peptidase (beta-lactamase class C family)